MKKELKKIAFQKDQVQEGSIDEEVDIQEKQNQDKVFSPKKKKKVKKEKKSEKEPLLNLHQFDQTEQTLLKLLWKNGTVQANEALMPRKKVLEKAGGLKGKSGVLSNLYAKLLERSYIEFDKRYKAKASLIEY
jgi:hypothetical protein